MKRMTADEESLKACEAKECGCLTAFYSTVFITVAQFCLILSLYQLPPYSLSLFNFKTLRGII